MKEIIQIQKVSKTYQMGEVKVKALDGITMDVESGKFVAIIGPSGSGKSTYLHLLGGLDTPDKGKVIVQGKNLQELKDKKLAKFRNKSIGFIFQSFNLQPKLDAYENVELPLIISGLDRSKRKEKVISSLKKVGLGDRIHHKPSELSGGQQQRVSIARALVNSPKIILADEPTGNLDSKTGLQIIKLLKKLNNESNVTVIVVTHDDRIAKVADKIVRIRDGKIVEVVKNGKEDIIKKHTD